MSAIQKQDLKQISYQQFGDILDRLLTQIQEYSRNENITFDVVVPILRSGAFTGMHIASKLGIKDILPMQYKYIYTPQEHIIKKFEAPKLNYEVPSTANILITDSNTVWGEIAKKVIEDVHLLYPDSTLYFASANLDVSLSELPYIQKIFYGELSNESRRLSQEEANGKDITNDIVIFPWEDLEEQWQEISMAS